VQSIAYVKYFLNSKNKPRQGALLKVEFEKKHVGFADLHPWVERGDLAIDRQLELLKHSQLTDLTKGAIRLAQLDAEFRFKKLNAFSDPYSSVKNHALIFDLFSVNLSEVEFLLHQGFDTLKIKIGRLLKAEKEKLLEIAKNFSIIQLRLDVNAQVDGQTILEWTDSLDPILKTKIELIEDPCPYDQKVWQKLNKNVPLAADFEKSFLRSFLNPAESLKIKSSKLDYGIEFLVIKPARENVETLIELAEQLDAKVYFTSNLGHSIESAATSYVASYYKNKLPQLVKTCGNIHESFYQDDFFSGEMQFEGPYLTHVKGLGFGFDKELNQLGWINL